MFGWLRQLRKPLWWSFLLLLPFNITFYIHGLYEGVFLHYFRDNVYHVATQHFDANYKSARDMDYFSVPGAPGIHDVGVAPYYVPQLRDPSDWWKRLGMKRFDVSSGDEDVPIDQFARLDTLYRRTGYDSNGRRKEWHHWVYASAQWFQFGGAFSDQWDEAFNQLLQYHYVHAPAGDAQFHYLTCPGHFLCDIWITSGPALIHFTTETPTLWPDEDINLSERQDIWGYAPVTARLIELPLKDPQDIALPPGTFPSAFEQMRSLTADPHAWQRFLVHTELEQLALRLEEMSRDAEGTRPLTFGLLVRWHDYLWATLGGAAPVFGVWMGAVRLLGLASSMGVLHGGYIVEDAWRGFFGVGEGDKERAAKSSRDEERTAGRGEGGGDERAGEEDNFMAQMMRDFVDSFDAEEKVKDSPEGQEALERMMNIVRRKPVSDEEM